MWLLNSETLSEIISGQSLLAPATAAQQADFVAARSSRQADGAAPAGLTVAGDTAQLTVAGVLVAQPSFALWLLGIPQTSYDDIVSALGTVAADASVKRVNMHIDSPGGQVAGLFDALAAIEGFNKPIAVSAACACSAAYAIAAAAGPITASNAASQFGSVGVVRSVAINGETIDITSTHAPDKRPNAATPEGQAVIREHLDAVHELFAGAIATGRGTDIATVNKTYGRGATVLAGAAKQRGMIDSIAATPKRSAARSRSSASSEAGPLTQAALDAFEHREPAPGESLTAFAERSMRAVEAAADTRDTGDCIADAIDAQIDAQLASQGKTRRKSIATYSEPLVIAMPRSSTPQSDSPKFDMGDAVAAIFDAQRTGKKPPTFPQLAKAESASAGDVGDAVVLRMEQQGLIKPERSASR